MASGNLKLLTILCLTLFATIVQSSKLNVPHVLLPIFDEINTNFTLEAVNGGCYTWRTTRVDLVQLTLVDPDPALDCSDRAIVSAIGKEKARNVAIVLAEEINTKLVLRVDVIVDVIHSLNISTTTKEIIMDEVPEIFKVVAHDSQGNQFTTLEGIDFDWKIICMGPKKDLTVLRFMSFGESPYETPPEIELFEEQNRRGHIVLLEGIKSGSTKVQVRLPYEEYSHVNMCEVQLSVIANLIILPADVYLMAGDVVSFKVYSMKNGIMEEIELTNNLQYYLDAESKAVASVDPNTGDVSALTEGKARVVLHDRNVEESDPGLKLPFATLTVVTPAYLAISVLPYRNFAILLSEHHDIVVEAYTSNDNKLHLGPGVQLNTQVGEIFLVQQRTQNGSWLTGWAQQEGVAPVQATLEGVVHPRLGRKKIEPISVANDIFVYPRIILSPAEVILPWDSIAKPKYQVEITATGGDGKFLWSSSNHSIGVVSQSGVVRTHYHGYFEVSAAMQKNHHNRQSAKFHILPPSRLEIVEYIMEAEVGSVIFLHVALFAEKLGKNGDLPSYIPFTRCQDLPFKVTTSDSKFIRDKTSEISPVGISCANVAIIGHDVGTSKISVQYLKDGKSLEDSVTVSAYRPLRLLHPKETIVLAVGSSLHLVYTGGPRPSLGRLSDFKRIITSDNSDTVDAKDVSETHSVPDDDEVTVVNILCRQLGESDVSLSVSNMPIVPSCRKKDAQVTVRVICGKPRSVFLQPAIKVADASSCPMDLSADRVVVQSDQDVELDVIVKDENGLRFLNISTLKFEWSVNPSNLGILESKDTTIPRYDLHGNVNFETKSYQVVTPRTQIGEILVKTKITGYHRNILSSHKIKPEWPEFLDEDEKGTQVTPISTEISLYLVDDTIVTPDEITIYNHPGNKKTLSVKQGSGYYELALSNDNVAEVKYFEGTREIAIVPISTGELRINVIDLCLVSRPAVILVTIVSVGIIRVEMSDKVELGKCIPCIVKLYDESDNLLNLPNLDMIDLSYTLEADIASVQRLTPDVGSPWPEGEVHFVITGQVLGDTKITFSVHGSDEEITSAPLDLQVFSPLYLFPRNATLVMGSSLQYSHKGGPQPDSNIEYTVVTKDIADVNTGGILKGLKLGRTKVNARALGVNPTTGQKLIYAQDSADVTIIPITGVRILAPLTRFQIGARVPVWATGLPEQLSPMILGTIEPALTYNWGIGDSDMIEIQGVFQKIGVYYDSGDQISVRLTGITPGRTKLYLNVTVPGVAANCAKQKFVTLTDSVDIEVFEGLALTAPNEVSGLPVLMAPHSSIQLQTNMDSIYRISYKLLGEDSPGDTDLPSSPALPNPVVTISDAGLLQSHGNLGYAMVLIIATDDYGLKQSVSVIVKVKAIHYMMLNVVSNWMIQTDAPNNVIPLGTEFELKATYHDNTGNVFTAGTADLRLRTSRFDLARVKHGNDNSTLIVSVKKPGHVVLKVWADGIKKTADYVKLHIQQTIAPLVDYLITGDIVCLWTPVTSKASGKWSSSDRNLLIIDADSGIGYTVGARGGYVTISNSLHPVASVQVQVLPVTQIVLVSKKGGHVLTNAIRSDTFRVPLVFVNEQNINKKNNFLNGWQCKDTVRGVISLYPFTCYVKFSNDTIDIDADSIIKVISNFNVEEGQYSCDVVPTGLNNPTISTLDTNIILTAESNNGVVSDPLEIEFIPAIFVEPDLVLDEDTYTAELFVIGTKNVLSEITVTPSDKNLLQVYDGERISENMLKHEVRLLDYHWKLDELAEPLYLRVVSQLTKENVKVIVRVQAGDKFNRRECAARQNFGAFFYNHRQTIAVLGSMMVIFFVTFYAYSNYVQPVINVNVTPTRSLLSPGGTANMMGKTCINPNQCNAMSYMQSLQRSPQSLGTSNVTHNMNSTCGSREPVYGDPTSFYSTSPELRRNRRFM